MVLCAVPWPGSHILWHVLGRETWVEAGATEKQGRRSSTLVAELVHFTSISQVWNFNFYTLPESLTFVPPCIIVHSTLCAWDRLCLSCVEFELISYHRTMYTIFFLIKETQRSIWVFITGLPSNSFAGMVHTAASRIGLLIRNTNSLLHLICGNLKYNAQHNFVFFHLFVKD